MAVDRPGHAGQALVLEAADHRLRLRAGDGLEHLPDAGDLAVRQPTLGHGAPLLAEVGGDAERDRVPEQALARNLPVERHDDADVVAAAGESLGQGSEDIAETPDLREGCDLSGDKQNSHGAPPILVVQSPRNPQPGRSRGVTARV